MTNLVGRKSLLLKVFRGEGDVCRATGNSTTRVAILPGPTKRVPAFLSEKSDRQRKSPDEHKDQRKRLIALLKAGADLHAADKNGVTALHHAVRFRNPGAVETLIEYGADVNQACRKSGSTPLHRAVTSTGAPGTAGKRAEARRIVTLLLTAAADPSIGNKKGETPRDYATDEVIQSVLATEPKPAKPIRP